MQEFKRSPDNRVGKFEFPDEISKWFKLNWKWQLFYLQELYRLV